MSGTGVLTNSVFSDACDMMEGYLLNRRNEWLDDTLPCDDIAQAAKGMYAAMEAANLAIDAANDVVQGMSARTMETFVDWSDSTCLQYKRPFMQMSITRCRRTLPAIHLYQSCAFHSHNRIKHGDEMKTQGQIVW